MQENDIYMLQNIKKERVSQETLPLLYYNINLI